MGSSYEKKLKSKYFTTCKGCNNLKLSKFNNEVTDVLCYHPEAKTTNSGGIHVNSHHKEYMVKKGYCVK